MKTIKVICSRKPLIVSSSQTVNHKEKQFSVYKNIFYEDLE